MSKCLKPQAMQFLCLLPSSRLQMRLEKPPASQAPSKMWLWTSNIFTTNTDLQQRFLHCRPSLWLLQGTLLRLPTKKNEFDAAQNKQTKTCPVSSGSSEIFRVCPVSRDCHIETVETMFSVSIRRGLDCLNAPLADHQLTSARAPYISARQK